MGGTHFLCDYSINFDVHDCIQRKLLELGYTVACHFHTKYILFVTVCLLHYNSVSLKVFCASDVN